MNPPVPAAPALPSDALPTLAGIGLAPLAQWVVVPGLALWCLREWHPVRLEPGTRPPSSDEGKRIQ